MAHVSETLVGNFSPRLVGIGVPGGCEAGVQAVRRFMESMPDDYVIVKLHLSNAFNCLHRSKELPKSALRSIRSVIWPIVITPHYSLLTSPSRQNQVPKRVIRYEGYCSASQFTQHCYPCPPPLSRVHGRHNHWLGEINSGLGCRSVLFRRGKIGLHLNVAKFEVITNVHQQFDFEFQGFVNTHLDDTC